MKNYVEKVFPEQPLFNCHVCQKVFVLPTCCNHYHAEQICLLSQKLSDCEKRNVELYDKGLAMHVEIGDLKEKLSSTEEKLRHFEERVDNQNATVEEAIRQQQAHRQTEEKLKIAVEALEKVKGYVPEWDLIDEEICEALTKIEGE